MRVPHRFRDCCVFVGVQVDRDGQADISWRGTAFLVGIPSPKHQNRTYLYLVTARHVIAGCTGKESFLRVNLKGGGSTLVKMGQVEWIYHSDDSSADVAVLPMGPWRSDLDLTFAPSSMLLAHTESGDGAPVGIGDEVFITGLFSNLAGNDRNLPIVRTGTVAMLPPCPVQTTLGEMSAYLIEARSIGGLSGAPVFVRESKQLPLRGAHLIGFGKIHLLGLIHGHWDLPPEATHGAMGSVNMGIALVVPAHKIREALDHPELLQRRTQLDEDANLGRTPVADSDDG